MLLMRHASTITKEGLPALRRSPYMFRNGVLTDIDPEFEQFDTNPWRSP